MAIALFGSAHGYSSPVFSHGARHARSPQFGGLFGGCSGNCNRQKYK